MKKKTLSSTRENPSKFIGFQAFHIIHYFAGMKKIVYLSSFLLFYLGACTSADKESTKESENDVDAARNFIQAALLGDYDLAQSYMLQDSVNTERMNVIKRINLSKDEKAGLASASINIHDVTRRQDSTTIVIYSNSFKNNHDTLKVIKNEGKWLVDFKYLFEHAADSASKPVTDSLR